MAASDLVPPREEGTVAVAADRRLGVAELGPRDGKPVFWFHGTPGARRQVPPAARRGADELGARVIGVERPGTGSSTGHLYPDIRAFADDIAVVADELGVDRFGVIGLSGGGPYVLACAEAFPDRVVGAVVLGGVAPTVGDDASGGGPVDLTRRLRLLIGVTRLPLALVLVEPFDAAGVGLLAFAAVACPLGQIVASAALPGAGAHAPALRRLDTLLVLAPVGAAAAGVF